MIDNTDFLICDDLMIQTKYVSLISKNGTKYIVRQISADGKYANSWDISKESYQELKDNLLKTQKYEKKIKKLEQKVKSLQNHISLMPGGSEFLMAQDDFNKQKLNI